MNLFRRNILCYTLPLLFWSTPTFSAPLNISTDRIINLPGVDYYRDNTTLTYGIYISNQYRATYPYDPLPMSVTINTGGDINLNNNRAGIYHYVGSPNPADYINIIGDASGTHSINITNSSHTSSIYGIYSFSINGEMNISNLNINIDGIKANTASNYGIYFNNKSAVFSGVADGTNSIKITNSESLYRGIYNSYNGKNINFTNMSVEITGNTSKPGTSGTTNSASAAIENQGMMTFTGSDDAQNYILIENNGNMRGIVNYNYMNAGPSTAATMTVNKMDIIVKGGSIGIDNAANGYQSKFYATGKTDGSNFIKISDIANGTKAYGYYGYITTLNNISLDIRNVTATGADASALHSSSGLFKAVGIADGSNYINATGATSVGGKAAGINSYQTEVSNMDIYAGGNKNNFTGTSTTAYALGLYSSNLVQISGIDSPNKTNVLSVGGNTNTAVNGYAAGLFQEASTLTKYNISGMDIYAGGNKALNGTAYGAKFYPSFGTQKTSMITGFNDGRNNMYVGGNEGKNAYGIYADRLSSGNSGISIDKMNIYAGSNTASSGESAGISMGWYFTFNGADNGKNVIIAGGNTAGGRAAGILFEHPTLTTHTYKINNYSVDAGGNTSQTNSAYGIYVKGALEFTGTASGDKNTLLLNGSSTNASNTAYNAYGLYNNYSSFIKNTDISASSNTSANTKGYGIYAAGKLDISGRSASDKNNLILHDNSSFGFTNYYTTSSITNMNIDVKGNDFAEVIYGGTLNITDSPITIRDNSTAFTMDYAGTYAQYYNGTVNLTRSSVIGSGGALLASANDGIANLKVDNSIVTGHVINNGRGANITLTNNSSWFMKQSSDMTKLNSSGSFIDLTSSSGFNTLTAKEINFNNDIIRMNTKLGNDASQTDKIIVTDTFTGSASLLINNTGGLGTKTSDGIKIVDASTTAVNTANLTLAGGVLDTSAYEYRLHQGSLSGTDNKSWYLRSTKSLTNTAKTMGNEPSLIISMAKTGMNNLYKRMGELRHSSKENPSGTWVRTYGKNLHVNDFIDSKMNIFGIEGGVDRRLNTDETIYLGIMTGYMSVRDLKFDHSKGSQGGNGSGYSPSVGLYATWLGSNGWFVDGTARTFWENLDITSYSSVGIPISYSPDRQVTVLSMETGKKTEFAQSDNRKFFFEPKLEVSYGWADAKSFTTNIDTRLRYGNSQSLTTRTALDVGFEQKLDNGAIIEPYIQVGATYEWKGKTNITYDNEEYKSNLQGVNFEVGGGLNVQMTDAVSMYTDLTYEKGETTESVSGNIGFRYSF